MAHIPIPRRILLVEADQWRHDFLQCIADADVDATRDPDEAIAWLQDRVYSDLWLNHDLGCEPKNGRDISTWLIAHPLVQPWLRTRVHSMNEVSAPKIVRELTAAGRPAVWVPLAQLAEQFKREYHQQDANRWKEVTP
jgi:hypothetical protein